MCIAAVAWQADPRWRIVAVANRDEFHARPTAPLSRWNDGSGIVAGRDLRSGGTWLGASRSGRFALLTNFRAHQPPDPAAPSRGGLVAGWLASGRWPQAAERYSGFNLLLADDEDLAIVSNRPAPHSAEPGTGILGLSNGPHDSLWPKTRRLCARLSRWLNQGSGDRAPLFAALAEDGPDAPAESEDAPIFIRDPVYGTRSSTVFTLDHQGKARIEERSFDAQGGVTGTVVLEWRVGTAR